MRMVRNSGDKIRSSRGVDASKNNRLIARKKIYTSPYKTRILSELEMLEEALSTAEVALNIELEEDILHVKDIKEELLEIKCEIKERMEEEQLGGKEVLTD